MKRLLFLCCWLAACSSPKSVAVDYMQSLWHGDVTRASTFVSDEDQQAFLDEHHPNPTADSKTFARLTTVTFISETPEEDSVVVKFTIRHPDADKVSQEIGADTGLSAAAKQAALSKRLNSADMPMAVEEDEIFVKKVFGNWRVWLDTEMARRVKAMLKSSSDIRNMAATAWANGEAEKARELYSQAIQTARDGMPKVGPSRTLAPRFVAQEKALQAEVDAVSGCIAYGKHLEARNVHLVLETPRSTPRLAAELWNTGDRAVSHFKIAIRGQDKSGHVVFSMKYPVTPDADEAPPNPLLPGTMVPLEVPLADAPIGWKGNVLVEPLVIEFKK